ncbi:hypothetical protein CLV32_2415 [Pedobacter duraquae]|uniref:Uncharacterized protein n=1 Tax=Pedobacter duraquae TaxID=425511 RepID=A0A4R6IHC4_9SPHI|nr:hypothetical protein CLV32_2415 [Pedobacter duraquae]
MTLTNLYDFGSCSSSLLNSNVNNQNQAAQHILLNDVIQIFRKYGAC